jgi:predicted AAA+ superfamily ATPase
MIRRSANSSIIGAAKSFPIVAITGPRQSGKTTLAQHAFDDRPYVSFEDPETMRRFESDPKGFLAIYKDGAVFDDAQRCPELFSYLQGMVDGDGRMGRFVLTGSSQFQLISGISQSLAGRVVSLNLLPFSVAELRADGRFSDEQFDLNGILFGGLYPPIWDRSPDPTLWYSNYVQNYVERDVRLLINISDLSAFQRFLRLCAARCGQLINYSEIAAATGVTHNTIKAWISVLEASYVVFTLKPFHNNFSKRLVKTPKLYFYDSGLLCWLLSVQSIRDLDFHPMRGAVFESFVISELIKKRFNSLLANNLYFWRDRSGTEIDVIEDAGRDQTPIEIKAGQTFQDRFLRTIIKWKDISGSSAMPQLIYGGDESFTHLGCRVRPWQEL